MEIPPPSGLITLLTDFGTSDPYVGIMKGVIKSAYFGAEIVDVCHDLPVQDIAAGALYLEAAAPHFPTGTVHLAVVDPGVGTDRQALAVCARGSYWIGPDNGLLSRILPDGERWEVRKIDLAALGLEPASRTFHGRDVFAPVAAMLSSRRYGYRALGPRAPRIVRLQEAARPHAAVIAVDRFGNLITGVTAAEVAQGRVAAVEVKGRRVPVRGTYAEAQAGDLLALINSYDLLEIAQCRGSAASALDAGVGQAVSLCQEPS